MPTITPGTLQAFAADPAAFRSAVVVDCDGRAVLFREIMEPRQREDFLAADPGWRQAVGLTPNGEPKRLWSTRPRGASKTTDSALQMVWALAFAPQRINGIVASGDRDQARIVAGAVRSILDRNDWLTAPVTDRDTGRKASMIECQSNRIRNCRTGSVVEILSADAPSSFGFLVDLIIVDEIANWPPSGEAFWVALASTLAKRPRAMATTISNAGFSDSWQRRVYDAVSSDPRWHVSHWNSPPAWMPQALLDEQRALLPAGQYSRLFENKWSSGSGDAIEESDIAAALTLPGPPSFADCDADRRPCFGGLDLSTRRDRSALVVLAADPRTQRVELRYCRTWRPGPSGVDLSAIRTEAARVAKLFRCPIIADPFQASLMLEDLRAAGVRAQEQPFTGPALNLMASKLLQAFRERRLDLWDEPELVAGLRRLNIVERSFGVRLEATRDSSVGHCDAAVALSLVLPRAMEAAVVEAVYSDSVAGQMLMHSRRTRWRPIRGPGVI